MSQSADSDRVEAPPIIVSERHVESILRKARSEECKERIVLKPSSRERRVSSVQRDNAVSTARR